jgi:4-hydroxy-3-polyprenylbenzoate decarboxylase
MNPEKPKSKRLIVAITGASGVIYGVSALKMLRNVRDLESHLIVSPAGWQTLVAETGLSRREVEGLADAVHDHRDIGASLASGSFVTAGMLIAPCSIKTLSGIAHCYADNLIVRAADVCLKERRPVVAMVRETPLHLGHIELMERATRYGVIVMPPVPAFYSKPKTIDDLVDQTAGRALDLLGIDTGSVRRWKESRATNAPKKTPR